MTKNGKGIMRLLKGVAYFSKQGDAEEVLKTLLPGYPEARIVEYQRGFAVQYRKSGAYYPEKELEKTK